MEQTTEFYLNLAEAYNTICKEDVGKAKRDKVDPLADAYLRVRGEDAEFYTRKANGKAYIDLTRSAQHDAFVVDFATAIGAFKLTKPIYLIGDSPLTINAHPLAASRPSKRGIASLDRIVADKKDTDHKPLRSIYIDNGIVVATDAFKLVAIKSDDLMEYDGEVLQFDGAVNKMKGVEVAEYDLVLVQKFPDYKAITPDKTEGVTCNVDELLAQLNGTLTVCSNLFAQGPYINVVLPNGSIYVACNHLYEVARALKANGAKSVELCYSGETRPLSVYANNDNYGLIMYVKVNSPTLRVQSTLNLSGEVTEVIAPEAVVPIEPVTRNVLSIDIETYSPVDIKKSGVYPYAEHEDFEILLFAYAFDDEPVKIVDLASGEVLPEDVINALLDPKITKTAYNALFERTCIARMLGVNLPPDQWECTMVKAAMAGYPFGLGAVAKAMGLAQEKMSEGKALIRYFCMPCKATKTNGGRERNIYSDDAQKWNAFKEYCLQDVVVERAIREKIAHFTISGSEKQLWVLDQKINDRGVMVDVDFVKNAIEIDRQSKESLTDQCAELTDLDNPNSAAQLKKWLSEELGMEVDSLTKEAIKDLLKGDHSDEVVRVLQIRQEMAKTSVKKYEAMVNALCDDGCVHGLLQFYGASRTGRWAGRLVQVQNLPQNHLDDLDLARSLVKSGDIDTLELCYGNVPDTLSQLIRTAFIAGEGKEFIVADFSAIEARVIAWLAGERWRQDVFATHGKIYEASAAAMFGVPIDEVTKGSPLRQKGKVAELALGYQGGANALMAMGALKMGLQEDELQGLVDMWRNSNRAIVALWDEVNKASMRAIKDQTCVNIRQGVTFSYRSGALYITLPSGRDLVYLSARIGQNRFGRDAIVYAGMEQQTKQWGELETYGGKLVENIVQAIARDCLAVAMLRLDTADYKIVMHVHDEVVVEATEKNSLDQACEIMGQPIEWAKGLLLRADGYVTPYYKKD